MDDLVNWTYDEIQIGQAFTFPHRLTTMEVNALAFVSGETDAQVESDDPRHEEPAAESAAGEALLSALLKRRLPGPGTTIIAQHLKFWGRLNVGDEVIGRVAAWEKHPQNNQIVFDCLLTRGDETLISGTITVAAPTTRIRYNNVANPTVVFRTNDAFARLLRLYQDIPPAV